MRDTLLVALLFVVRCVQFSLFSGILGLLGKQMVKHIQTISLLFHSASILDVRGYRNT